MLLVPPIGMHIFLDDFFLFHSFVFFVKKKDREKKKMGERNKPNNNEGNLTNSLCLQNKIQEYTKQPQFPHPIEVLHWHVEKLFTTRMSQKKKPIS